MANTATTGMTELNIDEISLHTDCQPRAELDAFVIDDYATAMRQGSEFPPIVIFRESQDHWLASGFHRVAAAKQLGLQTILATIRLGSKRDAMLFACGTNAEHGLRRTNADKRKALLTLLKDDQWRQWSDAEIARRCKVTHPFVGKTRAELTCHGYKSSALRRGADGRVINTHRIGLAGKLAPEVRKIVRDTSFAEDRKEVSRLAQLDPDDQFRVGNRIAAGDATSVNEALRDLRNAELAAASIGAQTPPNMQMICSDFRSVELDEASVELVFSDPPYAGDSVDLYGSLASFANHILRPSSWCLAYTGLAHLPQVLKVMSDHLEYAWTFAVQHSGPTSRFHKLAIHNTWKPIVAFYKPPIDVWWPTFRDSATGGREKDSHEWQQAVGEAEHFIRHLCPLGGTVVDPMCGSGTSLVAAARINRGSIGIDIEATNVAVAKTRVAEAYEAAKV